MNTQLFTDALGELNEKYVIEAIFYRRKARAIFSVWLPRVACVLLAILLVGAALLTFSEEARAIFAGFIKRSGEFFDHYSFEGEVTNKEPEAYELGWTPEGLELVNVWSTGTERFYIYSDGTNKQVVFSYTLPKGQFYVQQTNTEEIPVTINGCSGVIYSSQTGEESDVLVWEDSEANLLFYIHGFFDRETFIKMAESVRVVE